MKYLSTLLVFVLALFLAACGGGADEESATSTPEASEDEVVTATIQVEMHDIYFGEEPDNLTNPPVWTVPAGAEVTVELENLGALQHNWAVAELNAELPDAITDEAEVEDLLLFNAGIMEGGTEKSATFTAPTEPGEYRVICTVAGHYPVMQGRLVVQ